MTEKIKKIVGRVEVIETVERTERMPEEGQLVTRDGEDTDLRMGDHSEEAETKGPEVSMHPMISQESTTLSVNESDKT